MTTWAEEQPRLTDDELRERGIDPDEVYTIEGKASTMEKGYVKIFPDGTEAEQDHYLFKSRKEGRLNCGKHPFFDPRKGITSEVCVASFHRASDGALSKFIDCIKPVKPLDADFIILPGDRKETFEFALEWYGKKPLIHLWAGEISQGTHDEIYRWAITNMSFMQWCTNESAAERVRKFCETIGKKPNVRVVGNVMLDNIPRFGYDLVLYNPPTTLAEVWVKTEIEQILQYLDGQKDYETYFWLPPNGDAFTHLVEPHVTTRDLSRNQFLNLLKNCTRFISNSSCIEYEARHIIPDEKIICIGKRNEHRSSKEENMAIPDATSNMLDILEELSNKTRE